MISYDTPAKIAARNAEAEKVMAQHACDEAWDAYEGAVRSGFPVLAREEHARFRAAYARKIELD